MRYLLPLFIFLGVFIQETAALEMKDFPVLSKKRLELTRKYAKRHYGIDDYILHDPKMIVVHYSGLASLGMTLGSFQAAELPQHREKLLPYGDLNVGVHFVVDYDGKIYSLLPTTVMGRHTAGYNHVSIGITNVAGADSELSPEQVKANADIIHFLTQRHPSIEYLIGHLDYMQRRHPHFKLFKENEKGFDMPIKMDPGWPFMKKVRAKLINLHGVVLEK